MKGKACDLDGRALDLTVAQCEGEEFRSETQYDGIGQEYAPHRYSSNWDQAGPIIEREGISILRCDDDWGTDENGYTTRERVPRWSAAIGQHGVECCTEHQHHEAMFQVLESEVVYGPTPLIAAMRCYVRSKLGETVDLQVGAR